jgi:hypothetical protein
MRVKTYRIEIDPSGKLNIPGSHPGILSNPSADQDRILARMDANKLPLPDSPLEMVPGKFGKHPEDNH